MWSRSGNGEGAHHSIWRIGSQHDDFGGVGDIDVKELALPVEYWPSRPAWHANTRRHSLLLHVHDRQSKRIRNFRVADIGDQQKIPGRVISKPIRTDTYTNFC